MLQGKMLQCKSKHTPSVEILPVIIIATKHKSLLRIRILREKIHISLQPTRIGHLSGGFAIVEVPFIPNLIQVLRT